ncbi:hypothetical protein F0562_011224 [Nyssa sinensis]|uniref:Pectate lyase superfamily protein domain-containing protein n=1 Tax=Nyssa sinensis TaxID=561372 RepID=A0A5J5A5T1_9ASTE|nr:hypothetical protein F0562_011224 [Nyssa sinensis]
MAMKLLISLLLLSTYAAEAQVFDVTKYGAKPKGEISQALLSAWKEACASPTPSSVVIPAGTYASNEVTFSGPCKAPIETKLVGTLQANPNAASFKTDGWVVFEHIEGFTLSGGGTFDRQGAQTRKANACHEKPSCPKLPYSPNTDGIHVGRSSQIYILDTDIKTGDDCISIGDGSQQVHVERVTCGPGHGISVGSLGKYPDEEPVSGIFVKNCTLTDTSNGVRIKSWPATPGRTTASDMHFENIIMNNAGNPVLIDQEYCPWGQCKSLEAMKLVCSKSLPCENVEIADIDLAYHGPEGPANSTCANIQPKFTGKVNIPEAAATCGGAAHA